MAQPLFSFVTSNPEKVFFAKKYLDTVGIEFETISIDLIELQAETPEEIVKHKVEAAYAQVHKPVVGNDHWWSFPGVGGFPGPYMRFMNDHMTAQDLLRLLNGVKDRRAILTDSVAYFDGSHYQYFHEEVTGSLLESASGAGVPGQQIICLSGDGLSIATHINRGTEPRGENSLRQTWEELATWLQQTNNS